MVSKRKKASLFSIILFLILLISAVGGTLTFARFYGEYEKKTDSVKIADAVMKVDVDAIYRTDAQKNRVSQSFNKKANEITINDVEPGDDIEYYFTVSGTDGKRINEVPMNATLSVTVRLETLSTDESGTGTVSGKQVDYFGGWTTYDADDGVKDGGYLRIYHGSEADSAIDIRPSSSGTTEVDFEGKSLLIENSGDTIVNKTGFTVRLDDEKKEYSYHLKFTLPKQSSEKENYTAGARVYIDVQVVAEQVQTV